MDASPLHCIVIGAGAVGASCALQLVDEGHRVTLVDRLDPGMGTSYGNAACISPSQVGPYSYPGVWKNIPRWLLTREGPMTIRWGDLPWTTKWLWSFWRQGTAAAVECGAAAQAALMTRVHDDYEHLLRRSGQLDILRDEGLVVLYDTEAGFEADRWRYELGARYGFGYERLDVAGLKQRRPAIRHDGVALFVPSWKHTLDPARMTAGFASAAVEAGARLVKDAVEQVSAGEGQVSARLASGETLNADRLVIAAGPWSNRLAEQLDYPVPMGPKRGYHTMIGEPGLDLVGPVMSGNRAFVMTPLADGLRLAGTAEFARLDAAPDYRRARVLVESARRYLPDLQTGRSSEWMGQRPMMADSVPVISPSPAHPGVIYAFGHGHYGLTQGPTTARIVADLVAGRDTGMDLAPYRFDRFRR
ncbi:FAD-binding oxidoreductase [Marinihelvus fidelis]|uniref:FAD-binding oxidoreductase n=1 Tax=Marinihelvus fidelis TaxID=2613842 RepID=A0A5N0TB54_9GAMM|nr:FAD-binding oxidoreductase [Marinihelvus fidelis]KAA9131377.1 FAD-binding oxidoreductase [Marinihelvus fidelis]